MSHARRAMLLGFLLTACTSGTPDADPAATKPAASPPEPTKPPLDGDCDARIATYLSERAALSRCETDSDCAEIWPGLCPHGPYYVHREADVGPIFEVERTIEATCSIPDCEPPMELGIAHCEKGSCQSGRTPAKPGGDCWDYRETYLEPEGAASETTSDTIRGVTPQVVIAPAHAGTLVLEVDWPKSCTDCRLLISEHNSGMARLVTPKVSEVEAEPVRRERLELAVTPGPYHMIGMASSETRFLIRAELRDAEGRVGRVSRHGIAWQRLCED